MSHKESGTWNVFDAAEKRTSIHSSYSEIIIIHGGCKLFKSWRRARWPVKKKKPFWTMNLRRQRACMLASTAPVKLWRSPSHYDVLQTCTNRSISSGSHVVLLINLWYFHLNIFVCLLFKLAHVIRFSFYAWEKEWQKVSEFGAEKKNRLVLLFESFTFIKEKRNSWALFNERNRNG